VGAACSLKESTMNGELFIRTRTRGRVLQRWKRLMQEGFISNLVVFII
jgi:hypothetical protein